ncbi:MAG TPA: glycosyltransferase family 2 protein [Longimicrobiales bacterium]|nr:glycosyltransferase family 2 protein [Longimicrobiales bacterium]
MASLDVSIVVPLLDEEENLRELTRQVREAMRDISSWELILVDDGSEDRTPEIARELAEEDQRIRALSLARRYGQSTAMQAGFDHARGGVVVTLDGDLQNDPADIPSLVNELRQGYDLVVGYRVRRKDRLFVRKIPSWFGNRIIRWITGVEVRDNGCSLKAYRATLLERMRLYSDMHRFIPAIAAGAAGARITEIPVNHRPRVAGQSKYGISKVLRVLVDLLAVTMIRSFRDRLMHLFSALAAWCVLIGSTFVVATFVASGFQPFKAQAMVFPSAALLWFSLATFLILLGLVAEAAISRRPEDQATPLVRELG